MLLYSRQRNKQEPSSAPQDLPDTFFYANVSVIVCIYQLASLSPSCLHMGSLPSPLVNKLRRANDTIKLPQNHPQPRDHL